MFPVGTLLIRTWLLLTVLRLLTLCFGTRLLTTLAVLLSLLIRTLLTLLTGLLWVAILVLLILICHDVMFLL